MKQLADLHCSDSTRGLKEQKKEEFTADLMDEANRPKEKAFKADQSDKK